jgi:hypothetical protein
VSRARARSRADSNTQLFFKVRLLRVVKEVAQCVALLEAEAVEECYFEIVCSGVWCEGRSVWRGICREVWGTIYCARDLYPYLGGEFQAFAKLSVS